MDFENIVIRNIFRELGQTTEFEKQMIMEEMSEAKISETTQQILRERQEKWERRMLSTNMRYVDVERENERLDIMKSTEYQMRRRGREAKNKRENESKLTTGGSKNDNYDLEKHLKLIEGEGNEKLKNKNKIKSQKPKKYNKIVKPATPMANKIASNSDLTDSLNSENIENKSAKSPKLGAIEKQNDMSIKDEQEIIKHKKEIIEIAQVDAKSLIDSTAIKITKLISAAEDAEIKSQNIANKMANIDLHIAEMQKSINERKTEKVELAQEHKKSEEVKHIMNSTRRQLEDLTASKLTESKKDISKLKEELEQLQTDVNKETLEKEEEKPPNQAQMLLDYISQKILTKMQEVECPVCLEQASTPIFMCQDLQHLVCSSCRPRLKECPECRQVYRGAPKRHR